MRKIFAIIFVVALTVLAVSTVSAAEQVATRYLDEKFVTAVLGDQPLATSTTSGFNGWTLQRDEPQGTGTEYTTHYEKATAEGTELTVTADPSDPTNTVLKLKRTVGNDTSTENMAGGHTLLNGATLSGDNCDMVKIGMKMMYTSSSHYLINVSPAAPQIRQDAWQPNGGVKTDYASDKLAIMKNKPNQWIDIEFVLNYRNNTISFYADDTLIDSANITPSAVSKITFMQNRNQWQSVSTVYVDDVYVDAITTVASYRTDKIFYSTENGEFTATATDGGLLKQAYITKAETASGNVKTVFVCYDAAKNMQAIKVVDLTAADFDEHNLAVVTVDMALPEDADLTGGQTKVLFMESFATMKSLEDASVFDITADKAPTLYLLGDSIMANYREVHFPRAGTGMMIGNYFDDIQVLNYATSGAGTDTTLGLEGAEYDHSYKWREIQSKATAGDYILIQLGTNDAGDDIGVDNYIDNMDVIVDTMNKKGVNVILGSMYPRHAFDENGKYLAVFDENGKFVSTDQFKSSTTDEDYLQALYDYIDGKETANTPGFMSIDTTATVAEMIGPDATQYGDCSHLFMLDTHRDYNRSLYEQDPRAADSESTIFGVKDPLHITIYGADVIAQATARMIYGLDVPLSRYVNTDKLDDVIEYPHFDYQYAE